MSPIRILLPSGILATLCLLTLPTRALSPAFPSCALASGPISQPNASQGALFKNKPINPDFVSWLAKRVGYLRIAALRKVSGRVWTAFVVEPDRTLSNLRIISSPNTVLSRSVLRALRNIPEKFWTPATESYGRATSQEIVVPVCFHLN